MLRRTVSPGVLCLCETARATMFIREREERSRGFSRTAGVCNYPLELDSFGREKSLLQTRRRRGIYFLGRLDGGSAVAIIHPGSSTRLLAAGAHLRPHLGDDGCGTRVSTAAGRMREQRQALAFPGTKFPSYRRTR